MKKFKKSLALFLVLMFAATAVLAGCGGGKKEAEGDDAKKSEEQVSINILFAKDDAADAMEQMAQAFMDENPNITVVSEMVGPEFDSVLRSKDAAGKLPDIFAVWTIGEPAVKPWVEAGKVADVSGFKVISNLPEDIKKTVTLSDGKIYTVPLSYTAYPIIYNKELFEKAGITAVPRTLDELKTAVDKLKAINVIPFAAGAKDGWTLGNQIWRPAFEIVTPQEWSDKRWKGEASFKDYGLQAFDFIDLFKANTQPKPLDTDYMTQMTLFAEGKAAMMVQGPWAVNNVADMSPEMEAKAGAFPIPFTNDPAQNKLYLMQEMYWLVSSKANLEAVDKFFDFMINGSGKEIFAKEFKSLNPYGVEFEANNAMKDILSYIDSGEYVFNYQDNNMPDGFFMLNAISMQEYLGEKITKEQMLEKLDQGWDEFAKK